MENPSSPTLADLFATFVRERRYMKGVSSRTEDWYLQSWKAFSHVWEAYPTVPTIAKGVFASAIESMIRRGVSPITVNTYARAINAFLRWLHEEGKCSVLVVIPRLKEPTIAIQTYRPEEIHRLFMYRAKTPAERRVQTLALLVADTGMRLNEAMSLKTTDVDLDNLLITIREGKGGKQRIVPFSIAMRKVLYKHVSSCSKVSLVFCTRDGLPILQNNIRRDFSNLCKHLGIGGNAKGGFHVLRHGFATEYLRRGGDVIRLGRVLGHSTLEVTRRYVHLQTADLSSVHERLSVVANGLM
jgi:integrase/recombinase XerD